MSLAAITQYLEHARRCTDYAATANSLDARRFFETCASAWKQLADDRERELATWGNPLLKRPSSDDDE